MVEPQRIRADYASLQHIALALLEQAYACSQAVSAVEASKRELQAGDWVSPGAQSFYAEMDTETLPALRLMVSALQNAAEAMDQLVQVIRQAEAEAGKLAAQLPGQVPTSIVTAGAVGAAIAMAGQAIADVLAAEDSADPGLPPGGLGDASDWSIDDLTRPGGP
jgi:hypothetical protein